ncbi:MAG TPA: hypothetical protein VI934_04720 [Candidatus Nanoarchaeia archaeon]|nr:hypothetical protein [Candidatus Nanoarchaeia archaeon]
MQKVDECRKGTIAGIRNGTTEFGQQVTVYVIHPDLKHTYCANRDFSIVRDPVDERQGKQLREGQHVRLFRDEDRVSLLELTVLGAYHYSVPDGYILKPIMPFWQKAAITGMVIGAAVYASYSTLGKLLEIR